MDITLIELDFVSLSLILGVALVSVTIGFLARAPTPPTPTTRIRPWSHGYLTPERQPPRREQKTQSSDLQSQLRSRDYDVKRLREHIQGLKYDYNECLELIRHEHEVSIDNLNRINRQEVDNLAAEHKATLESQAFEMARLRRKLDNMDYDIHRKDRALQKAIEAKEAAEDSLSEARSVYLARLHKEKSPPEVKDEQPSAEQENTKLTNAQAELKLALQQEDYLKAQITQLQDNLTAQKQAAEKELSKERRLRETKERLVVNMQACIEDQQKKIPVLTDVATDTSDLPQLYSPPAQVNQQIPHRSFSRVMLRRGVSHRSTPRPRPRMNRELARLRAALREARLVSKLNKSQATFAGELMPQSEAAGDIILDTHDLYQQFQNMPDSDFRALAEASWNNADEEALAMSNDEPNADLFNGNIGAGVGIGMDPGEASDQPVDQPAASPHLEEAPQFAFPDQHVDDDDLDLRGIDQAAVNWPHREPGLDFLDGPAMIGTDSGEADVQATERPILSPILEQPLRTVTPDQDIDVEDLDLGDIDQASGDEAESPRSFSPDQQSNDDIDIDLGDIDQASGDEANPDSPRWSPPASHIGESPPPEEEFLFSPLRSLVSDEDGENFDFEDIDLTGAPGTPAARNPLARPIDDLNIVVHEDSDDEEDEESDRSETVEEARARIARRKIATLRQRRTAPAAQAAQASENVSDHATPDASDEPGDDSNGIAHKGNKEEEKAETDDRETAEEERARIARRKIAIPRGVKGKRTPATVQTQQTGKAASGNAAFEPDDDDDDDDNGLAAALREAQEALSSEESEEE